jgi:hypothetical protein
LKYIQHAAKLLLEDDYHNYFNDLKKITKHAELYLKEKLDEKYDYHPDEVCEAGEYVSYHFFERFSEKNGYTTMIDWSGEEDENHLKNFIMRRLEKLGIEECSFDFIEEWESALDMSKLARGEYIILKFGQYSRWLDDLGLGLIFYSSGGDCYFPFVATKLNCEEILSLEPDDSGCHFEKHSPVDESTRLNTGLMTIIIEKFVNIFRKR